VVVGVCVSDISWLTVDSSCPNQSSDESATQPCTSYTLYDAGSDDSRVTITDQPHTAAATSLGGLQPRSAASLLSETLPLQPIACPPHQSPDKVLISINFKHLRYQ